MGAPPVGALAAAGGAEPRAGFSRDEWPDGVAAGGGADARGELGGAERSTRSDRIAKVGGRWGDIAAGDEGAAAAGAAGAACGAGEGAALVL